MYQRSSLARLAGVLVGTLLGAACQDVGVGPERSTPDAIGLSPNGPQATDSVRIAGVGSIGAGSPAPGSDVRDFDLDVASTLNGRLVYRDWFVVRADGSVGKLTVAPTDTTTRITAFRDGSTACPDPTRGVEFDGIGRVNTGGDSNPGGDELLAFTVTACDNGPAGSGVDYFAMVVPAHDYARGDPLSSGDLVKSSSGTPPPPGTTGDLVVTTTTTGSAPDPDGYAVTLDGTDTRSTATSGSVTFPAVPAMSHRVVLSGVAANCTISGGDTQTITVPSGDTATAVFVVICSAPNQPPTVSAGPDQTVLTGLFYGLSATFSDPDDPGPWSYTIEWGDGSTTTGTTSSPTAISATHTYLLPGRYNIRVTVTDSQGASGSDVKVLTVIL